MPGWRQPGRKQQRVRTVSEQSSVTQESKAYDAVIVAVGIVAVLLANVAYVGYLTPPGGPDPYWAECYYSFFVAFTYLNGFSLVFAVAAIFAVTFGPVILIRQGGCSWRGKIVRVGLLHLGLSLLAFVGAFACAGFVTALLWVPPTSCSLIRCSEGGIPCPTSSQPIVYQNDTWGSTSWQMHPFLIDLNMKSNLQDGNVSQAGKSMHVCANYNSVGRCHHEGTPWHGVQPNNYKTFSLFPDGIRTDETPCFCILPDIWLESTITMENYGPSTWCSLSMDGSPTAHSPSGRAIGAQLELNVFQTYNFLAMLSYQEDAFQEGFHPQQKDKQAALSAFKDLFSIFLLDFRPQLPKQGTTYTTSFEQGACFKANWSAIQSFQTIFFQEEFRNPKKVISDVHKGYTISYPLVNWGSLSLDWSQNLLELYKNPLVGRYMNFLGHSLWSRYSVIPCCQPKDGRLNEWGCRSCASSTLFDAPCNVFKGRNLSVCGMQGDESLSYTIINTDASIYRPLLTSAPDYLYLGAGPLGAEAINYATMRYICSGDKENLVLCDKGDMLHPIDPPLAVDFDGHYLTRKDVIKYSGRDIAVSGTTTSLTFGVVSMLIVAVLANSLTCLWLSFEQTLVNRIRDVMAWQRQTNLDGWV